MTVIARKTGSLPEQKISVDHNQNHCRMPFPGIRHFFFSKPLFFYPVQLENESEMWYFNGVNFGII